MKGFVIDLYQAAKENTDYRRVMYTGHYSQLVLMSLKPGEEIGNEVHGLDQFIRIEQGQAKIILNNGKDEQITKDDWAVIVPAGTFHNIINVGKVDLKLFTVYSPPVHQKNTIQPTKADEKEDHFDGQTTEN